MNKTFLLIAAAVVGALLALAGVRLFFEQRFSALLTRPPSHGTRFLLEAEIANAGDATDEWARLREAIRQRAARLGVRIYWEPTSDARVSMVTAHPNAGDAGTLQSSLFSQGVLAFRLVHEESEKLIQEGLAPVGYELLKREFVSPPKPSRLEQVLVQKRSQPGLSGTLVEQAMVQRGALGEPEIAFELRPAAAAAFAKVTSDNIGHRLAIVLDGKLCSAPRIQSPITTGRGVISGSFTSREAAELAAAIETPLPIPVRVVESKSY